MSENLVKKSVALQCKTHGEYHGFEISIPGLDFTKRSHCPICTEIRQKESSEFDRKEKAFELDRKIALAGIFPRFKKCTLDNYKPTTSDNSKRVERLKTYINDFVGEGDKNILLFGKVGLGKSHLATAMVSTLIRNGRSAAYTNVTKLLSDQKDSMNNQDVSNAQFMASYATCSFLVLDEFGLSGYTEHEKVVLNSLLNERYERMLPTMLVGNVNEQLMTSLIGERSQRRLYSSCITITLDEVMFNG